MYVFVLCPDGQGTCPTLPARYKRLRITAGMTDGFHTADKRNGLGYHFGLGTDRYVNGCHKWVFGGEYLQKYYPYKDIRVPVSQFTAEGGYYYNFLSDANKVFLCYAGGSVLAGYETVNWGTSTLFDGSRLCAGDAFVYGGAVSLEIEPTLPTRWYCCSMPVSVASGEMTADTFISSSGWASNS